MPELSREAALRAAFERKSNGSPSMFIELFDRSPRHARLLLQSGDPSAWIKGSSVPAPTKQKSAAGAVLGFAASEIRHLVSGQTLADPDTVKERLAACEVCPHNSSAPNKIEYHLGRKVVQPENGRICGLCGCFISAKARRLIEKCPDRNADDPHRTRWNQPI